MHVLVCHALYCLSKPWHYTKKGQGNLQSTHGSKVRCLYTSHRMLAQFVDISPHPPQAIYCVGIRVRKPGLILPYPPPLLHLPAPLPLPADNETHFNYANGHVHRSFTYTWLK